MIIVRITMNVLPEKQLEVTQTLLSMIDPTGKEKGCLSYAVFCNIEDKNLFNLMEEWETREDHGTSYKVSSASAFCLEQRPFYANRRKFKFTRFPNRKEWRPFMQLEVRAADSLRQI